MTNRSLFTSQEWQTLQFAPLWVFGMVASADQNIDEKEFKALAKELAEAPLYKEPLVREVLMSVGTDFKGLMDAFKADSRTALSGLGDVATVLDAKATAQQSKGFKGAMMLIAKNVAEASGGGILRRDPVAAEEKTAIVMIGMALKFQP